MKNFSKIVVSFLVMSVLVFNFSFAEPLNDVNVETNNGQAISSEDMQTTEKNNVPFMVEGTNVNTEKVEQGIENIANKGESLLYTVIGVISDISLPICALLVLWGAVLYFILGIRNLYKKRQGLLLMWGAFTFLVIAKVVNFAFWFAFVR